MATLTWGTPGERYFETGTDRGVLYPKDGDGVPWNGLISVSEAPTGGEAKPYYLDGFKYLNTATAEEFAATIEAFSAPAEFGVCDGTASIHNGLFITQQRRQSFGFSYRTRIGNDTDGPDHGYKLHLVYNALAAPSTRNNVTLGDSADAIHFSWAITTAPPAIAGFKPSAHFVVDSRKTPPAVMSLIESTLYGSSTTQPRLPEVAELIFLFESFLWLRPNLVMGESGVYEILTTDVLLDAAAVMSATAPAPSADGSPILWLDTSVGGMQYATGKLITGD